MAASASSSNNGNKSNIDGTLKQDATVGVAAGPSSEEENITWMAPAFYKAAADGVIDAGFSDKAKPLHLHVTRINKNTVLHIHLSTHRRNTESVNFAKKLLDMCPLLLPQANAKGETSLHMAVRYAHDDTVKFLVESAEASHKKELERGFPSLPHILMMTTNKEKDTALHQAIRLNRVVVANLLTREDPNLLYSANVAGETPLYLAAQRGFKDLVVKILRSCPKPAHGGPSGSTGLHAAVIGNNEAMTAGILDNMGDLSLTTEADNQGWTPLHYAAYTGSVSMVKLLLEHDKKHDKDAAYMTEKGDGSTALHIAAGCGRTDVMEELISYYPDCCELVDKKGRNFIHLAVATFQISVVQSVRQKDWLANLINEKDFEGKTPLHPLMNFDNRISTHEKLSGLDDDNSSKITPDIIDRALRMAKADQAKVIKYKDDKPEVAIEQFMKARETHLLVATLIATVTFAAGFTLPGGYIPDKGPEQGTPVLIRKAAFKAFVIADTIAMVLSSSSVFIYFFLALPVGNVKLLSYFLLAYWFTVVATGAMVVAFMMGFYAVLEHSSDWLAIVTCVIASFFFIFLFYPYAKQFYMEMRKMLWKFI